MLLMLEIHRLFLHVCGLSAIKGVDLNNGLQKVDTIHAKKRNPSTHTRETKWEDRTDHIEPPRWNEQREPLKQRSSVCCSSGGGCSCEPVGEGTCGRRDRSTPSEDRQVPTSRCPRQRIALDLRLALGVRREGCNPSSLGLAGGLFF